RLAPGIDQVCDVREGELARNRPAVTEGDRARRHDVPGIPPCGVLRGAFHRATALPWTIRPALAARVAQLDAWGRPVRPDHLGDPCQRRDEAVIPQAEIAQ